MRKGRLWPLVLVCLFSIASCVSTGKTPQEIRYTQHRDLRYGPYERNVLDLSVPDTQAPKGVILFIHGGIWMFGSKEDHPVFLDDFRDSFIVGSMNHRYLDETTHIWDLEEDVAAAAAYIREFCERNHIEAGKLIVMGHSSGAHLAMLYAYKQHAASPIPIAFCVDMAGPADLSDIAYLYNFKKLKWEKTFYSLAEKAAGHHMVEGDITDEGYSESGRERLMTISPVSFVTADSPPTIIAHDVADNLVPYANSAVLNSLLTVYGIDHDFLALYSGIGHFLGAKRDKKSGALRYDKALETRIIREMNKYIEKYCGNTPGSP